MKIKLIIWDLDNTLWSGTLADGHDLSLNHLRVGAVRTLNGRGMVSAICSKNDPQVAKARLVGFGIWDDFVFPNIGFQPKGEVIAQMIEDMQLRPANVLLVDDNVHNLEEVRFRIPEINVIDASKQECDTLLQQLMEDNAHISKSRVAEYRSLEQRNIDRKTGTSSNEEFLKSCDIRVCTTTMTDNLLYAARIEDLINRSNQLNFTKSRIPDGSAIDMLSGYYYGFWSRSVFVWDKYGYHGLVGFAAVSEFKDLLPVYSTQVLSAPRPC